VRESNTSEATGWSGVGQAAVRGELVTAPQDQTQTSRLEEDRLLELLALPAQGLVEGPGAGQVTDTERDQADALFHGLTLAVQRVACSREELT
jgi:hypothetical protein